MESLFSTYASSDEEDEAPPPPQPQPPKNQPPPPSLPGARASSLFSSLPKPQSALFSSLPQPKTSNFSSQSLIPNVPKPTIDEDSSKIPNPRSSKLFSAVPQPKKPQIPTEPLPPKRVIQIRPPVNPSFAKQIGASDDEEEDEDEDEKEKKRRRQSESAALTSSVHSLLFSMPAARGSSTLGALPSSGSGKRSIVIETDSNPSSYGGNNDQNVENQASQPSYGSAIDQTGGSSRSSNAPTYGDYSAQNIGEAGTDQNSDGYYGSYADQSGGNHAYYDYSYENYQMGVDQSTSGGENASYVGYESYAQQGPSFGNGFSLSEVKALGKKKKGEIPAEIVEVKQDELMKNRPREDQMKTTGIAFGPSYQPVSTKGKPSKLHKRKHQIGSLYFDMKQKEMELAERRARGFQTKAQTQGKYGW